MGTGPDWFQQARWGVRFEWGLTGATAVGRRDACLVVVDVLSFTTAVTVAVSAGTRVIPCRWRDDTATLLAADRRATLAVRRADTTAASPWSLSPAALRRAPFTPRLVLPSPNGSTIAATAPGSPVLAGCLRNATAVAHWLRLRGWGTVERPVVVIGAGERWPDNSLRPAVEDLIGAGAIIDALRHRQAGPLSPEATAAGAAYRGSGDVAALLADCASGRELAAGGYADDVAVAAEVDACGTVPVLVDGAFTAARTAPRRQR